MAAAHDGLRLTTLVGSNGEGANPSMGLEEQEAPPLPEEMNVMEKLVNPDPLVRRVVGRHGAALRRRRASTRVEYSTAGNIDAAAVAKLLAPTYGKFRNLWFRPFSSGTPHTVGFGGVTQDEQLVHGRVVLHTAVRDTAIVSWGEVIVEDDQIPF